METPRLIRLGILVCTLMLSVAWWASENCIQIVLKQHFSLHLRGWSASVQGTMVVIPREVMEEQEAEKESLYHYTKES